jgi:hypothetical protein
VTSSISQELKNQVFKHSFEQATLLQINKIVFSSAQIKIRSMANYNPQHESMEDDVWSKASS